MKCQGDHCDNNARWLIEGVPYCEDCGLFEIGDEIPADMQEIDES